MKKKYILPSIADIELEAEVILTSPEAEDALDNFDDEDTPIGDNIDDAVDNDTPFTF